MNRALAFRAPTALLVAALLVRSPLAAAIPELGAAAPSVGVVDAWDRANDLRRYVGKPILVIYEDKESASVNAALKNELSALAKGDRYRSAVALFAVADVGGYDFWPVRGFVKDAIRKESQRQGTIIYCDWDGHFRSALGLTAATSNVVLFDKSGRVIFSQAGTVSEARRKDLFAALGREIEP